MVMAIYKSCAIAMIFAAGTVAYAGTDSKPDAPANVEAIGRYTQAIIDAMDSDKNGEVSRAEFLDFMSKEFDRLDVNHDGKLQKSEILNKEILPNRKTKVR